MNRDYKHYKCPVCGCEFSIYVVTIKVGRYVTCPMDGRHRARECDPFSGVKDCMQANKYKRNSHGALEQE